MDRINTIDGINTKTESYGRILFSLFILSILSILSLLLV